MLSKMKDIYKIYQDKQGEYLPDAQQPESLYLKIYLPHSSTRYKNVVLGSNITTKVPFSLSDKVEVIENKKVLPELYTIRENCCGCTACYSICPIKAISMELDEEGFEYPVVDASKCIRCYRCNTVCPNKK